MNGITKHYIFYYKIPYFASKIWNCKTILFVGATFGRPRFEGILKSIHPIVNFRKIRYN